MPRRPPPSKGSQNSGAIVGHHVDGCAAAGSTGTDALIAIRGEFPNARIIMLSTSGGDGDIQRALRAGAAAYVLKSMPKDDILAVIRSVHAGKKHVPAEMAARLAEHLGDEDLTPRELEVLRLIRDGHRNKQIAGELSIAEATVNFHIKNLVAPVPNTYSPSVPEKHESAASTKSA